MFELNERHVQKYFETRFAGSAQILGISMLGQQPARATPRAMGTACP